jgi:hypothetical protein
MSEAEFERRQAPIMAGERDTPPEPEFSEPEPAPTRSPSTRASRAAARTRPAAKPRRVQRMFAVEEELDKKLWLYAIHMGKDRSDVVNDLLRPVVASMVLYDSRERRSSASAAGQGGRGSASDASASTPDDDQADVA